MGFCNCDVNAKSEMGVLFPLNLKLELVTSVSNLGGCAVYTLGCGTRTSDKIMFEPEWYMWTLC